MNLMAIDIGGTDIKYSVMNDSLTRRDQGSIPTPQENQSDLFEAIKNIYEPHKNEVQGIAISMPGFIDSEKGLCCGGGALKYNRRTQIARPLSEMCGCPVHIANDGKCAAYAELMAGSLTGCGNAAVYVIGTGVGGGIIIDGKVVNGKHYTAGEYSFLRCDFDPWDGINNMTGNRCSTTGLINAYRARTGLSEDVPMNGRIFFERLSQGEEEAAEVLDAFAGNVARSIANIAILLDLEKVAVGGGISRQPILIQKIDEALTDLYENSGDSFDTAFVKPEIIPCRFQSDANMVGAYLYYQKALRK